MEEGGRKAELGWQGRRLMGGRTHEDKLGDEEENDEEEEDDDEEEEEAEDDDDDDEKDRRGGVWRWQR